MTLLELVASLHRGQCFANLGRRFQMAESQIFASVEVTNPYLLQLVEGQLESDHGTNEFLEALAHPAVTLIQTDPRALADPAVRTTGETVYRRLMRYGGVDMESIPAMAHRAQVSHQSLQAMLPYIALLLLSAIRQKAEPAFRMMLTRHQPDDVSTDPFVFVFENVKRLKSIPYGALSRSSLLDALFSRRTLPDVADRAGADF